jgi:hypothetical protein
MRTVQVIIVLTALVLVGTALAAGGSPNGEVRPVKSYGDETLVGQALPGGKARADTLYLIGGPDRQDGDFNNDYYEALPDSEGWIGVDHTRRTESMWHIDTFNAELLDPTHTPNRAMWCGSDAYLPCGGEPINPGYGNNFREYLDWYGIVPNPFGSTSVTVTARLNYDTEPGWDFLHLEVERAGGMSEVQSWTGSNKSGGVFVPVDVEETFSVGISDYVGPDQNQVHLRWSFDSDGAYSDEDCLYPSDGAAQIDNLGVAFDGELWSYDDFEPGNWVNWHVAFPVGVGDFSWTFPYLEEIDDCTADFTPQWAFIDNGLIVPTGGYLCTTWCYGPDGYVVNPEGGMAGPSFHLQNDVWSPPIAWPEGGYDAAILGFNVYRHEPLTEGTSAGIFYVWSVRSTNDPAGAVGWSGWMDRAFVYYGGPDYVRHDENVSDLLVPDRKYVQISLGVYELGWYWGYEGLDATPAPYFDNVSFRTYGFSGPSISAREIDLAQDSFPEIGVIDWNNPGANSVRFDMAQNISEPEEMQNLPGDSIVFDVSAFRAGSVMEGPPRLYYRLKPNPLFDAGRTSGLPNEGYVVGDSVHNQSGAIVYDRWAFDLPDTGFFFPGDVIHYYVRAQDNAGGEIGTTLLPGDTTGFSVFPGNPDFDPLRYPNALTVRALPRLTNYPDPGRPPILFWNDFGIRGGLAKWGSAFRNLGFLEGIDYDVYNTRGPSSGVGNGLGGRATSLQLQGYETIIYTSGDLSAFTISDGDFEQDAGDDLSVLSGWLQSGGHKLLITGDGVVSDLINRGAAGQSFLSNFLPVDLVSPNLRPLIGNQAVPRVVPIPGNPVFLDTVTWLANGGCPILNEFDAVLPTGSSVPLAAFTQREATATYEYAAGIYNYSSSFDDEVIYLPYDLMYVSTVATDEKTEPAPTPMRTVVLQELMNKLGYFGSGDVVPVPEQSRFWVRSYPNPFNPATRIEYNMPRRGQLGIRIFNVRGELVRILLDEVVPAGPGSVTWDGTNGSGQSAASGVYFYEVNGAGHHQVQKLMMIK